MARVAHFSQAIRARQVAAAGTGYRVQGTGHRVLPAKVQAARNNCIVMRNCHHQPGGLHFFPSPLPWFACLTLVILHVHTHPHTLAPLCTLCRCLCVGNFQSHFAIVLQHFAFILCQSVASNFLIARTRTRARTFQLARFAYHTISRPSSPVSLPPPTHSVNRPAGIRIPSVVLRLLQSLLFMCLLQL